MEENRTPPDLDVAALRERLQWTQAQFAERFGVDRSTVSRWESGSPVKGPARRMLEDLDRESRGRPVKE